MTVLVVFISALLFLPNVLEQHLQVVFNTYKISDSGEKVPVSLDQIQNFIHDEKRGLHAYFPDAECKPEAEDVFDSDHRCVLTYHFITSARINEVVQASEGVVNEMHTVLLPHPIEQFFSFLSKNKHFKNLQVKMGLDLQGGMRATFRADFESYLGRLEEKYEPVLVDLNEKLAIATKDDEKIDLEARIQNIHELLTLSETRKQQLLSEAKGILDKRLASQNLTEPEVRVQPASYSIGVDMPGVANSSEVLGKIKDTVTVEYRIVNDEASDRINALFEKEITEIRDLYRKDRVDMIAINEIMNRVNDQAGLKPEEGRIFLFWRRGRRQGTSNLPREFRVLGPAALDGSDMTNAQENVDPDSGYYKINFVLSGTGADKFANITKNNVGKRLAILWGDRVVSEPRINSPIVGGNGVITGDFTRQEAKEVASVIREGALPLPLDIISVSYVGPGLGQDSIVAGIYSIVLGFILVIVVMLLYYRLAGFIAVIALFLNMLIMAAILSLMEFTLTLPGFAGVILTVGMAVDANVIIFEKIREELHSGKALSVAVDLGFRSSFWTILDANITTLIAALILYYNGDGPIKGFAITLFFGLLSSLFTSLYVSRLIFDFLMSLMNRTPAIVGLYKRGGSV